jgi:hypothetical protein
MFTLTGTEAGERQLLIAEGSGVSNTIVIQDPIQEMKLCSPQQGLSRRRVQFQLLTIDKERRSRYVIE